MRYLGGKSRIRKEIAEYLSRLREPVQVYWEPFVGAGWVLSEIRGKPNFASDICRPLIEMWKALQGGWQPPISVTEADYKRAKKGELEPALTAFIGFGCSWGGKWFGGLARSEGRNYASNARNSLLRKLAAMPPTTFFSADFLSCPPPAPSCLVYCDPPYAGATGYDYNTAWDPVAFWHRVRALEAQGHTVIVSEYQAPSDFSYVLEIITKTDLRTRGGKAMRIERLFRLGKHNETTQQKVLF